MIHQGIAARMRETSMSELHCDAAAPGWSTGPHPALENRPTSPNVMLNLGARFPRWTRRSALAFAFFVAYIDDRVKSSFDIESVIGLPLVGIIPEIKRTGPAPTRLRSSLTTQDKQVVPNPSSRCTPACGSRTRARRLKCHLGHQHHSRRRQSPSRRRIWRSPLPPTARRWSWWIAICASRTSINPFRLENIKGVIDVCAGEATPLMKS